MASRYQQFIEYAAYCKCDINKVLNLARLYGYTDYNITEKHGLEMYLKKKKGRNDEL